MNTRNWIGIGLVITAWLGGAGWLMIGNRPKPVAKVFQAKTGEPDATWIDGSLSTYPPHLTKSTDNCGSIILSVHGNASAEINGVKVHNDREARAALGMPPCRSKGEGK